MAEILCDMLTSTEPTSVGAQKQTPPDSSRRQRMVIRRCRISPRDVEDPQEQPAQKRRGANLRKDGGETPSISYGMSSVRGRRVEMEDAVSARPNFVSGEQTPLHFFGVFDGHGCSHVAVSCRDMMHEVVAQEVGGGVGVEWKGVMERSFARVDSEVVQCGGGDQKGNCKCETRSRESLRVGSTAVVAVLSADRIVVGNCGDSRAVLLRGGAPVPLSEDHKPDRPDELQRIQAAGGKVIYWDGARVLGVLAMSRAIGDYYLKPYVIAHPEVTITNRTEDDECLILASDGLWDVVSNETACQVARACLSRGATVEEEEGMVGGSDKACMGAAMLLTKLAIARGSSDNVTVVVVDLKKGRRRRKNQGLDCS